MENLESVQFQVGIVLNEKLNKFMFKSKEEKDKFLLSEYKFCLKEIEKHGGAFALSERKQLKIDLETKRVAHAIHSGFQQVAKTGVWNRSVNIDAIVA